MSNELTEQQAAIMKLLSGEIEACERGGFHRGQLPVHAMKDALETIQRLRATLALRDQRIEALEQENERLTKDVVAACKHNELQMAHVLESTELRDKGVEIARKATDKYVALKATLARVAALPEQLHQQASDIECDGSSQNVTARVLTLRGIAERITAAIAQPSGTTPEKERT